jgi:hypothetical protein
MRRSTFIYALFGFLLLADLPLTAQYPGGYPPGGGYPGQYPPGGYPGQYPPGTYPGGGYPQTGPGIPFPRRNKNKKKTEAEQEANLKQITGMLRKLDDKSIVVTADDSRNINFKRSDTTKFLKKGDAIKPAVLVPGDHVMVEASEDDQGYMSAVRVNLVKEGTAEDREKASAPVPTISTETAKSSDDDERPRLHRNDSPAKPNPDEQAKASSQSAPAAKPAEKTEQAAAPAPPPERANLPVVESNVPIDESDPGAPKLRRGGPAKVHKPAPPGEVAVNTPPKTAESPSDSRPGIMRNESVQPQGPPADPRIEKARNAVLQFTDSLPAYVCQEQIARFVNTSHRVNWQAVDIVSTEVVYENHKEQYRNLQINGKPVNKRMEELSGSWSTGEFATVMLDLFAPSTAADFRYRRQTKSAGRDAYLFDFEVERENSHWHVQVASQSILPAYHGSVWIDKETSQILRIEMQAIQVPKDFPLDQIESATDYQYVRISERQFLLPVHAEVLSCQRGSDDCSRNAIDFRNYHKYAGEATITFENK